MRSLNYAVYGAFLASLILAAIFFVALRVNVIANPLPSNFSDFIPKAYIVQSGSMQPAIGVGSIVIVQKSDSYNPNEVITFKNSPNDKNPTTHRIHFKEYPEGVGSSAEYLTAGDANEEFDRNKVKEEQIVGRVVFTLPFAGYLADFAKGPQGFILLVIVPATIIIYEELKFLRKEFGKSFGKFWTKFRKKKVNISINLLPPQEVKSINKASILLPVVGGFLVIASVSLAYFFDLESSIGNILGAAASYGEKTSNLYDSNDYTCPGGASNTAGTDFGNVILKKVGANLEVDVVITGANPNQVYDIWVNQDPGGCPLGAPTFPAAIATDASGNGGPFSGSTPLLGAINFWVSAVDTVVPIQVLRSPAVQFP